MGLIPTLRRERAANEGTGGGAGERRSRGGGEYSSDRKVCFLKEEDLGACLTSYKPL